MDTLQLTNYRKFKDTGVIHLKPITFLVGANSSGKSSFLKFFPLLKQSLGVNRNGTFLWYSSDVDFKDFRLPRYSRHIKAKGITEEDISKAIEMSVKLEISGKKALGKENEDFFSSVLIQYLDQEILMNISEDERVQVVINGHEIDVNLHPALSNNAFNLMRHIL